MMVRATLPNVNGMAGTVLVRWSDGLLLESVYAIFVVHLFLVRYLDTN